MSQLEGLKGKDMDMGYTIESRMQKSPSHPGGGREASMRAILLLCLLWLAAPIPAMADEPLAGCGDWLAKLASSQGRVEAYAAIRAAWRDAALDHLFCFGDKIRTGERSRALIHLKNETFVRLDQNTMLAFTEVTQPKADWLELARGLVYFISRVPYELNIHTPFVNATIKGTEFAVRVTDEGAQIDVFEGQVVARNAYGEVSIGRQQSAMARKDQAPVLKLDVRPDDAVQWTLYYPPVFSTDRKRYRTSPASEQIGRALDRYRAGDPGGALAVLDALPEAKRDKHVWQLQAGMLLTLGRVSEARSALAGAMAMAPHYADSEALLAIIDVVTNNKEGALTHARRAVELDSRSAAAHRALSYAYQAMFRLEDALIEGRKTVDLAPEEAAGWARLAELELMGYDVEAARVAADKAAALDPNNPDMSVARGFSRLMRRSQREAAAEAFQRAIRQDSSNPLARFGMALVRMGRGDVDGGTEEMSVAAALDPRNSLMRSYLGKAYFEQKRNRLAETQFGLAKSFDAKDPTPWFYEAIKRQTENRPVEAMDSLNRAIELNDNRAVYRSRQLLDTDRAVRGASLARAYDDLGFTRRALLEASKSLSYDATDYAAHRFLSDAYVNQPGQEVAQLSELLQAQLLQPININPVQPHLVVKGLNLFSGIGPGESAFKDFTSNFERNRPQLVASGVVGTQDTQADEAVLSGVHDRISYSVGQFHYHTDGFRPGADVQHDIYDAFLQSEVTDNLNLQFEYRHRETKQGPLLFLNLNPADQKAQRRSLNQDIARMGAHLTLTPQSHWLASVGYVNRKETGFEGDELNFTRSGDHQEGFVGETQFLFHGRHADFIAGGGAYSADGREPKLDLSTSYSDEPPTVNLGDRRTELIGHNAYWYSNIRLPYGMTGTLGLSYDQFRERGKDSSVFVGIPGEDVVRVALTRNRVNPKVGIQWEPVDGLRLRAAYFRTLKRPLAVDQTIEPTQVTGFNQFYDVFNGTASEVFGAAMDARIIENGFLGFEFTRKNIWTPQQGDRFNDDFRREDFYRAYANVALSKHWALTAEFRHDQDVMLNYTLETNAIPLAIKFFHDTGLYAQTGPTVVWQDASYGAGSRLDTDFVLLDAAIGYRLPHRIGIVSLEGRNLLDDRFLYQDANFKASDPFNVVQPYVPSRTIMGRLVLSF
jgi:tetratricopeptide (TPR) repeat protein